MTSLFFCREIFRKLTFIDVLSNRILSDIIFFSSLILSIFIVKNYCNSDLGSEDECSLSTSPTEVYKVTDSICHKVWQGVI